MIKYKKTKKKTIIFALNVKIGKDSESPAQKKTQTTYIYKIHL